MKKLKTVLHKTLNRDAIVAVRQVEHKMGLFRSVIIAPCYYKEIRGKIEYLVLEYGTIFSIDHLLWSVDGEVEGLQDGYLLMQVSEEYPVTQKIVDAAFATNAVIAAASRKSLN